MYKEETRWWMLQLQFPLRSQSQPDLFISPVPRSELTRKTFSDIPSSVRIERNANIWGLADLTQPTKDLWSFKLTVRPFSARIAQEPELGHLEETIDPRFFTMCFLSIPQQIIVIHKSSDVSRFARSAKTFAEIYFLLLKKSLEHLDMAALYRVEVDPIAQVGSFVEWVDSIEYLKKIAIRYTGPNLPAGPGSIVSSLLDAANSFSKTIPSRDVELAANDPRLSDNQIEELDKAAAARRLKLRARGTTKSGVGTSWSSATKPIPETAVMPFGEDYLDDAARVAPQIEDYIKVRLFKGQDDK